MNEITARVPDVGELWRHGDDFYHVKNKTDLVCSRVLERLHRTVKSERIVDYCNHPLDGGTHSFPQIFDGYNDWAFVANDAGSYILKSIQARAKALREICRTEAVTQEKEWQRVENLLDEKCSISA